MNLDAQQIGRIVPGSWEFTSRRGLSGLEFELDIKRGKCLLD